MYSLKARAMQLKRHSLTVYYAARDPRTPIYVRVLAALIGAYALSPIDLIPDFIPVIGYIDDLIIIPLGIALIIRLLPKEVIESATLRAEQSAQEPVSYFAAVFIIGVWLLALLYLARVLLDFIRS